MTFNSALSAYYFSPLNAFMLSPLGLIISQCLIHQNFVQEIAVTFPLLKGYQQFEIVDNPPKIIYKNFVLTSSALRIFFQTL
jgi:hypothetical protein